MHDATLAPPGLADEETAGSLAVPALTLPVHGATGEDLDRLFKSDGEVGCVVVLLADIPAYLITREHYYAKTGGPFGFTLYQKKPVEALGKPDPLVVDERLPLAQVARLALERPREDEYDPVIVCRGNGAIRGIVTVKQLLERTTEQELRLARLSNPLTRLPGGPLLAEWLEQGIARGTSLTVAFASLAGLREYNDVYGLAAGDEMVRRAARVLSAGLELWEGEVRLAHTGSDDFVLVSEGPFATDALRELCARFDRDKLDLFRAEDLERGFFDALDDRGNPVRPPLVLLTVTVVSSRLPAGERHPAVFAQKAAPLRRTARALANALRRSVFVADDWTAVGES